MSDFNGVEDTLFIPLVSRIYASKNYKEFFYDEKALELEPKIPSNLIEENTDEYFTLTSITRFVEFDYIIKEFLFKHNDANIVNLGAGLETSYFRIKPTTGIFYEIDFPDVIKQRKIVLGENPNEKLIGSDILDYSWMEQIDSSKPTLFIVSGVFQYLHREDIIALIKEIKSKFSNSCISFDATNKSGLKGANKYVKKTGNENARMYFYLNDVQEFVNETQTKLIGITPFFKRSSVVLKDKLSLRTKIMCFFGDRLGFTKIVNLKIN